MDRDQLSAFTETARRFAVNEVAPLVGTEGRDGDLGRLPELFAKAESVGLVASPDPESAGYEYGAWGMMCVGEGPAFSLAILRELAVACAGFAASVHFAGLGAREANGLKDVPGRVAVAFFEGAWRPRWDAFDLPPAGSAQITTGERTTLSGGKAFVQSPVGCEGYVVYAGCESKWRKVFVPAGAAGVHVDRLDARTGLAAMEVVNLTLEDVRLGADEGISGAAPKEMLTRWMLGLSAVAIGNAVGALSAARAYAADRYQGGAQIETHPAVRILIGGAASTIDVCSLALRAAESAEGGAEDALWLACSLKLAVTTDCCRAVSDLLQVLGGYGYMEDYRLEKRLRDAMTLKTMSIRPDDLRMLCADRPQGGER